MSKTVVGKHKTTCSYCGVGCGIVVHEDTKGHLTVEGDKEHPSNRGMLCSKGKNLHYVVADQSDRLIFPQLRKDKNLPLERVSWDTALDKAVSVFKSLISKHGPDSVGFYISGQCLTEEYYLANKIAKGFIGTNNIDTNSRLCMSSAVVGYKLTFGEDSVPVCYDDIELADCFLVTGANPAWCHPIIWRRVEAHKEKNPGVKIIVVDPRRTQTCAIADLHLQIRPGTDIALNNAIARSLIENDWIDKQFIEDHTDGFEAMREAVMLLTLEQAASICEVPADDIEKAARMIGEAKGFLSMWTMGLNQSVNGVSNNTTLHNLSLITGNIGKPGAGPFSLTGQPNAMGGREVGGMATLLSAHRDLGNAEHRREVAEFWGVESVPVNPGLTATEMFDALNNGKLKAIWIICTNPSVSLPDARMAERAMQQGSFVIVQEISADADTINYADIVLPAAGWLEKDGTMTNAERRISYINKVVDPPGEALPDSEILCRFARKMGFHGFNYKTSNEIFDEHCRLTKGSNIDISGLSYAALKEKGTFQWPVPINGGPGTARLFEDKKFYTATGRAKLHAITYQHRSEMLTPDLPLILTNKDRSCEARTTILSRGWTSPALAAKFNTLI